MTNITSYQLNKQFYYCNTKAEAFAGSASSTGSTGSTGSLITVENLYVDEVISLFTEGKLTVSELQTWGKSNMISINVVYSDDEKRVTAKFKCSNKNYEISCTTEAAKSQTDNTVVATYTSNVLKKQYGFTDEIINKYFEVAAKQNGKNTVYVIKSDCGYENAAQLKKAVATEKEQAEIKSKLQNAIEDRYNSVLGTLQRLFPKESPSNIKIVMNKIADAYLRNIDYKNPKEYIDKCVAEFPVSCKCEINSLDEIYEDDNACSLSKLTRKLTCLIETSAQSNVNQENLKSSLSAIKEYADEVCTNVYNSGPVSEEFIKARNRFEKAYSDAIIILMERGIEIDDIEEPDVSDSMKA